jgi:DNA-binding SARP family transcriptional activator
MQQPVPDAPSDDLEQHGLSLWFLMDYPRVGALLGAFGGKPPASTRIGFLADALSLQPQPGVFEQHLAAFARDNDREGQYAAAAAGVLSIWNSGADLQRYGFWHAQIIALLADRQGVSPLAVGALLGFKALIELTGENNLQAAAETYAECLDWCELAAAIPLRAFHTTMRSYTCFWRGELARADMLLADAAALCAHRDTPWPVFANFEITRALSFALQGRMAEARAGFERIAAHPAFAVTPPFLSLLKYGHQLYALAQQGITQEVEDIAARVRQLALPESNYFHHSYLHFCLGIAHNLLGQPARGLLHARHAIEIGFKSHSAIARRMPALVVGQSLVDLGHDEEAMAHLSTWIHEWRASGYAYFAFAGGLELASVLARRGDIGRARMAYEEASACLPPNETVPQLLRPPGFLADLHARLFERPTRAWRADEQPARPIQITTFGKLAVSIRGQPVYDRQWHGARTRELLNAILAFGPDKVRLALLADALWPDSDADHAMSNLKVGLSRLRRIGCAAGERPLSWVVVRNGCVSLPAGMCFIDFAAFEDSLDAALQQPGVDLLARSLEAYVSDFLAQEQGNAWVVERRTALRHRFLQGASALAERSLDADRAEIALPVLQKAAGMEPDNEILCGLLMDVYLRTSYPSRAIEAYRRLADTLASKQGGEPGARLKERYARLMQPART